MSQHALLSPSSAHRWLHCTPAPRLEENFEDRGSDFAAEGTLAHAYCALKLKRAIGITNTEDEEQEIAELREKYYAAEMDEYTDTYVALVLERLAEARSSTPDARLFVETRLSFERYVPNAFGTADALIIADGTMEVIDFKYGKGVRVDAVENPQMMIYALGAYEEFSDLYHIDNIRMTIVQPRLAHLSGYEMYHGDLLDWAQNVLRPQASKAYRGTGDVVPGDWCRFCKAKSECRALAERCLQAQAGSADQALMSPQEIAAKVLPMLPVIRTWIQGVEEQCLAKALAGTEYPGYKVVEGRSVRVITNPDELRNRLTGTELPEEQYMKPAELRSLTELEKAVGKKAFAQLAEGLIHKPQGKPTLVPDSDKRPAIETGAVAEFKNINL